MAANEARQIEPATGIEWRRAWHSLRQLMDDTARTDAAIDVIDAVSGPSSDRAYALFAAHPDGRQLLQEKPSLIDALRDREALALLPEGSLGRAYLERVQQAGITADGLVEADEERGRPAQIDRDPDADYYGTRLRDAHDLWHVITGYGMDDAGEAAILSFSHGQSGLLGFALLALAAAALGPRSWSFEFERYLLQAWRRGRRARRLDMAPWEDWLERPLSDVRAALRIEAPQLAHPNGIIVAKLDRFPASA